MAARSLIPNYYKLLSGARAEWASLVKIEEESGFPPTAHPYRRNLLTTALRLGHLDMRVVGKRTTYRLTPTGELYLNEAFDVFGPVDRWNFGEDDE